MSTIIETAFTKYDQTEQEQLAGSVLTIDQTQFIQTQLAIAAESHLALVPDPSNYASFIQTEAELKGQMRAYQYLLDCSTISRQQLYDLASAQQATS